LLERARASIIATHVLVSPLAALVPLSLASAPMELPIRWDTPPACVEAAAVPPRVAALVGSGAAPGATLGLGAERAGERWRISLALETGAAESALRRTLEGSDCATLTEAVALVVAVRLDAMAAAAVLASTEEPSPVRVEAGSREGTGAAAVETTDVPGRDGSRPPRVEAESDGPAPDTSPRPVSRARPRALASFASAGELGIQPRAGAAFELAGGVGWPHARVELGALASVGPDATSEQLPAVGGRFRLLTGLVRGCGVPGRERVELPLCGGLELGDLRATGTGLERPATVNAPWIAAVASARPQWSPRLRSAAGERGRARLAFGALLDLVVPLRRHRFATPEAGLVHAVDPVAVRLGLRVELRLP